MGRKWNNIKYAKASKDANRSKIYAKFGKEIYMAAKSDPDPESNRQLKAVLDKAKTYNVTKEIIDRAINKAKSGVDESYEHIRYEGYGPAGSAIIVDTLTDNVNRTVADVRAAFNKAGGNLGVNGSVAFMFTPSSVIGIAKHDDEAMLELFIENDIDVHDIEQSDNQTLIYGAVEDFSAISNALKANGIEEFEVAEISMLANDQINLATDDFEKFEKLIDALEELDDVQEVYHNVELED
ncbi:YebC/PmpR family DNA-binding transcriptional regulator [Erysipelotrichaceae bacterium OttesenSCG-928-M19]|nr:YebC/PmpR family DNA-binding transcriptional regulator [Erysipelotrichaceae bacterium OttesenSCG-928-M19]